MPTLHPWAEQYMSRFRQTDALSDSSPSLLPTEKSFTERDWAAKRDVVAQALGCTVDTVFATHSEAVMRRLFAADGDEPTAQKDREQPLSTGEREVAIDTSPPPPPIAAAAEKVICGEPSVRDASDAISRYMFQQRETQEKLLRVGSLSEAERGGGGVARHILRTLDAVLSSAVRFSIEYATYADCTPPDDGKRREGRGGTSVYSLRGSEDKSIPPPPEPGTWDELAASQHLLDLLALPAVRSQLQRFAWPAVSQLHRSLLARVDDLFYKGGEAGEVLTEPGKAFLAKAGLEADVAALKEELFSFPDDMFTPLRPQDHGAGFYLSSANKRKLRASTRNFEVFVLARAPHIQHTVYVESKELMETMGAPPTNLFLPTSLPPRHDKSGGEGRKGRAGLPLQGQLWLHLAEMAVLRLLVSHLLSVELTLMETKRASESRRKEEGGIREYDLLAAAREVVTLARTPTPLLVQAVTTRFPSRAALLPIPDAPLGDGEAGGRKTLDFNGPQRYTSVTQLYNTFARLLRTQTEESHHHPSREKQRPHRSSASRTFTSTAPTSMPQR